MSITRHTIFSSLQEVAADIAREFREDASRWTQEEMARDASGSAIDALDEPELAEQAVCWCLRGAIDKRLPHFGGRSGPVYLAFDRALGHSIKSEAEHDTLEFVKWNDAPGRTVADVIALCERVASRTDDEVTQ